MDSGPRRKDGVRSGGAFPVMKGYGRQKEPPSRKWGFLFFLVIRGLPRRDCFSKVTGITGQLQDSRPR